MVRVTPSPASLKQSRDSRKALLIVSLLPLLERSLKQSRDSRKVVNGDIEVERDLELAGSNQEIVESQTPASAAGSSGRCTGSNQEIVESRQREHVRYVVPSTGSNQEIVESTIEHN